MLILGEKYTSGPIISRFHMVFGSDDDISNPSTGSVRRS